MEEGTRKDYTVAEARSALSCEEMQREMIPFHRMEGCLFYCPTTKWIRSR